MTFLRKQTADPSTSLGMTSLEDKQRGPEDPFFTEIEGPLFRR